MAAATDQGIVVPLTAISDPFGLKPLTSTILKINTVPQKSLFINITGSLSNIVIPNSTNRPMSASLVVNYATGNPANYSLLAQEVLSSAITSGNLTIPNANVSISITRSFDINDKIIVRVAGNNNSFNTNNIINPASFDSNLSLNISSTPNPSNTNMILEPYFEGRTFEGSSAEVMAGNIFRNIPNPFLQDIDYNRGPIPVNIQALISGSAQKGTVPESYYTSLAQTNIRYKGSKIQSTTINEYQNTSGSTDFGNPFNIGNYGKTPSIDVFDTGIFEFQWGGGTTPEIMNWGAFKIQKTLQVSSKDLVRTVNPSDNLQNVQVKSRLDFNDPTFQPPPSEMSQSIPQVKGDYYQILNSSNPINSEVSVALYTGGGSSDDPDVPPTTKILTSEFGVPTRSSFMYFIDEPNAGLVWANNSNGFLMNQTANLYRVASDYTAGSTINPKKNSTGDGLVNVVQRDINAGERWFFTFFTNLENGTFNSSILEPYNGGYTSKDEFGNYTDPFGFKGVYEILGVWEIGNQNLYTAFVLDKPNLGGNRIFGGGVSNSLGFLMWKARAAGKNEFIMVQDNVTGGVGAGALTGRFAPEYLTQNFESITKEYGGNQTG